jgi:hypothetical protein
MPVSSGIGERPAIWIRSRALLLHLSLDHRLAAPLDGGSRLYAADTEAALDTSLRRAHAALLLD